ncbi:MAG: M20/M25/M40 family metallo-hydrolase [Candidatus Eiseniibacteriota bacterium]|nr:MAG: M20/M25/M40 family metallo-hydrolase [Candidatus Eisenbacteria bacterium]
MRNLVGRELMALVLLFGLQVTCGAGLCAVLDLPPADEPFSDSRLISPVDHDVSIVELSAVPTWLSLLWLVPPSGAVSSGVAVVDIGLLRHLRTLGTEVRVLARFEEHRVYYLVHASHLLSREAVSQLCDVLWQGGQGYLVSVDASSRGKLALLRSELILLRPFQASLASLAPVVSPPSALPALSSTQKSWIEQMVGSVSEAGLFHCISSLSGEIPVELSTGTHTIATRYSHHPDCFKAAEYLYSQFDEMGVEVGRDNFLGVPFNCVEFKGVAGCAVGASGMIYRTLDGGETWEKQISGTDQDLWRTTFPSTETGWVVGLAGTLLKTSNGGSDWLPVDTGSRGSLYGIEFIDTNVGWTCGAGGRISKTTDGGSSWTAQNSGTSRVLYDIDFVGPGSGLAVGEMGTILKTSDGGQTWHSQQSVADGRLFDVCLVDSLNGWVVGAAGTILRTSDGGHSWRVQDSRTDSYLRSVCFVDTLRGWAVGMGGVLIRTGDGGAHWHVQQSAMDTELNSVSFINSAQGWMVGSSSMLRTSDGGASWVSLEENVPETWHNIVVTLEGTKTPSKVYIVCGHYDSFSDRPMVRAPGADDNASGTSLVVEAAKILKNHAFESTIRFICLAGEEIGLLGSFHYAGNARRSGEQIEAVLNFDMIGYGTYGVYVIGNTPSSWLVDYCAAVRDSFVHELPIVKTIDDANWRGDHWGFWCEGFEAITGIELDHNDNRAYHTPGDVVSILDMRMLGDVTRLAVASLASLAGLDTTRIAVATVDIVPNTLNLKSRGQYISCHIEVPRGVSASEVDVSTVMLNNSVRAEPGPCTVGDYNGNEMPDVLVKFKRESVQKVVGPGPAVEVLVSGRAGSSLFQGKDTIRVLGGGERTSHAAPLASLPTRAPRTLGLHQNLPNPFNPSTRITFSMAEAGRARLCVYDISGRCVRTLVDGWRESGVHSELWDGRTDDGRTASSGVYVCKLEAGGLVAMRKMALLR